MEGEPAKRTRVPIGMPIAAAVCLGLGLVAQPLIQNNVSEEQLARNVLLSAIPFILIFVAILLVFMTLIWWVSIKLNDRVSPRLYRIVETLLIAGICIGVLFIFQPWVFVLFRIGFLLLLFSTLGFIVWSHVRPRATAEQAGSPVSAPE
jgi:hypothetical protein